MQNTSFSSRRAVEPLRRLSGIIVLLIEGLLLAGCVVIPIGEEPPFDASAQSLEVGRTTRKDVLFTLGEPAAAVRGDALFAYTGYQLQATAIFFGVGREGAAGATLGFGKTHVLAIAFDGDGLVESVELSAQASASGQRGVEQTEHCIATGECFVVGEAGMTVFATEAEDRVAKTFAANPERCTVYVYSEIVANFVVYLDTRARLASSSGGYFLWHLAPGSHHVVAEYSLSGTRRERHLLCSAGDVLYLRFSDAFFTAGIELERVPAAEGQEEVRAGKLILDNL